MKGKAKKSSPVFGRVHRVVRQIPRRKVATYGQISRLIDGRLTAVGVGWALHACPDDVPWHRVVNARGGLSTEREAPGVQRALLEGEGVRVRRDGTVDLAVYQWPRGA